MIEDFIDGFEAAAHLIMRHTFDRPEDVHKYVEMMLQTLEEKKGAM